MFKITVFLSAAFFALCSLSVFAADVPQDELQSQQFNTSQCIDENTQVCINDQCLTSESTDCQEKCASLAKAKCQQQGN